jgi:hypothetical protein
MVNLKVRKLNQIFIYINLPTCRFAQTIDMLQSEKQLEMAFGGNHYLVFFGYKL